jgi:hypothetical protein
MFAASPEQSRSASPELFRHENKRYAGYKPSCNSDLELPNPMPLKDDKHVTRRRKSLAKSKTFTDKVRNPVPDIFPSGVECAILVGDSEHSFCSLLISIFNFSISCCKSSALL